MMDESMSITMAGGQAWIEATGKWDKYSRKNDQTYLTYIV
jgi:hypothetical protein